MTLKPYARAPRVIAFWLMRLSAWRVLPVGLLLLACRREAATPKPPSPPAGLAVAAAPVVPTVNQAKASAEEGDSENAKPTESPSARSTSPLVDAVDAVPPKEADEVGLSSGQTLKLWVQPSRKDGKSDIFGQLYDPKNKAAGNPKLIRRTSGQVAALTASTQGGLLYIAWISVLPQKPGKDRETLVALLRTDVELRAASAPVAIEHGNKVGSEIEDDGEGKRGPTVRLLTPAKGGAVVVYYSRLAPEKVWVAYVTPNLELRRWGAVVADGGDGSFGGVTDLDRGVLVWTFAWRGGASWGQHVFSYVEGQPVPSIQLGTCRPPMTYYFTGTELVTYCPSDYKPEKESCPIDGTDDSLCAKVLVQTLDGTVRTERKGKTDPMAPLLERRYVCKDGKWVARLRWKGGSVEIANVDNATVGSRCTSTDRAPEFDL